MRVGADDSRDQRLPFHGDPRGVSETKQSPPRSATPRPHRAAAQRPRRAPERAAREAQRFARRRVTGLRKPFISPALSISVRATQASIQHPTSQATPLPSTGSMPSSRMRRNPLRERLEASHLHQLELDVAGRLQPARALDVVHAVDRFVEHHGHRGHVGHRARRVPVAGGAGLLEELDAFRVERGREGTALLAVVALVRVDAQAAAAGDGLLYPLHPARILARHRSPP